MMIRKLLTTTALASVIATAALAQTTAPTTETPAATTAAPADSTMAPAATDTTAPASDGMATTTADSGEYIRTLDGGEYLASNLTGQSVYSGDAPDAESAGKINNFLVNNDGTVVAAIVDTAGLDESKVVAVPIDQISWKVDEAGDEPRGILKASREDLIAAPAFTEKTAETAAQTTPAAPATGTNMAATTTPAATPDATTAPAATADAKPMASTDMANGAYPATVGSDQFLSEQLIGENVYSGPGNDADSIGSVNDLVMADSGQIKAAVIGVGGFLGIGEKNVGVPFARLQLSKDDNNEARAVLAATKDQLKAAPDFNEDPADVADNAATTDQPAVADNGGMSTAPASGSMAANNDATMAPAAPSSDMAAAAPATGTTAAPATDTTASTGATSDRASMTPVQGPELTAEKLVGTTVYGPNDENIGEVGDIALSADGKVDAIIVDVGGFLGIGEKPVAVAMDNLQFMKDKNGSMYLYTQFTQDELKNVPEYNSSTYAENRDQMRIGADGKMPKADAAATGTMAPATDANTMAPKADGTAPAPAPAQ